MVRLSMHILVNGQERECPNQWTLNELVDELKLNKQNCIVELNKDVLKTDQLGVVLHEGDEVELMRFIGGG